MDFVRAFTFSFEDRKWLEKLLTTAVIVFVTLLLTPLFVGLLGWAALLGYQVELVRNWRAENPLPLPAWNNFSKMLNQGLYPLVALLIYQFPNLVISGTLMIINQSIGGNYLGSATSFIFCSCMLPIQLIYNAITLPMFALAMGRFVDDPRLGVFFEIGYLLVTLRDHFGLALLYVIFLVIVYIGIGIMGIIPLVGWVAIMALAVPVIGSINGQFALEILGKPKRSEVEARPPQPRYR